MTHVPTPPREAWFIAVAIAVAMVAIGLAVGAPQPGSPAQDVSPETPHVSEFTPPTTQGVASIDGHEYTSLQDAVDAAAPGDTIRVAGVFTESTTITTPDITISGTDPAAAMITGSGSGTVVTVDAPNVTLDGVWIDGSGEDRTNEDAGVFVDAPNTTITDTRITDAYFGIWVNGVPDSTITNTVIVGKSALPTDQRGNGIHLWQADGTLITDTHITQVRDGIYFAYSSNVHADNNTLWDLRYGVHYMYSNDNHLTRNLAFDNDVGFALMVSSNLTITENHAINNRGMSSHGILIKDIDHSRIQNNHLVGNGNGIFVYNSQHNEISHNLILRNDRGLIATAGTRGERVFGNSFIDNNQAAFVDSRSSVSWNTTGTGNYWSDARTLDLTNNGVSELRHQPTGTVEQVLDRHPHAAVFIASPAFDVVRLAEHTFPVFERPGATDHHPLTTPPHDYDSHEHYR